jgi:tetratricopeptide (TPR) repeat protein
MLRSARRDLGTICDLYVACMRVSLESRDTARLLSSALRLAAIVPRLHECRSRVEAELMLAFVQAVFGAAVKAERAYRAALAMAERLADPIALTSCHRIRHVILGWQGDYDACDREAVWCHKSSHWMELSEFCHLCVGMYGLESARGRMVQALSWVERALDRIHGVGRAPAILGVLEQAAYGVLASMRRDAEADALSQRLQFVERGELRTGHYFHLLWFQGRVQQLVACGELGPEFEALVDEFDRLVAPEHLHRIVAVHYIHVAHARVQQCLNAAQALAASLAKLDRAVHCVSVTSCSVETAPHLHFLLAAQAWFRGSQGKARRHLDEAERVAEKLNCPWASCASARLRAHMLRAEGKLDSALDRARIAALLARQYAQNALLREISREFELPIPADDYS